MGQTKLRYDAAYRQQAVELVRTSGKPVAAIARDLGVSYQTLHHWVQQARASAQPPDGLSGVEREELVRLRRQVKTLEMEREILKKATAFFAKESL